MIRKPHEIATTSKRFRILIAGFPGIGKTTLGLSAPAPLLIDVDNGIDRVEARFRRDYTQPENYAELLADLTPENTADYQTLVFDTGGQLIELMKGYVIKQNPKNGQSDGNLSLKGYGAVAREFKRLMDYCFYDLKKHVVVLFHAKEEKDGDNTKLRLVVEGSTKDSVWQPMDLGGFMEMNGNNRTIGFSNCERYYAKATHGIKGVLPVPDGKNTFLSELFAAAEKSIADEVALYENDKALYQAVMDKHLPLIAAMKPETIQAVSDGILNDTHYLTSKKELGSAMLDAVKKLGYKWDKGAGKYVPAVDGKPA